MDDFERGVLICLDPNAEPAVKARALEYCQEIQTSPDGVSVALAHLTPSTRPEVAFWCLQLIHHSVMTYLVKPTTDHPSKSALQPVLEYATSIVSANALMNPQPTFIRNKVSQIVSSFVAAQYPTEWPDAFKKFILPMAGDPSNRTPLSLDMFFRILRAIDDEVTSIRAAQSSDMGRVVSVRVKDAIRLDCATELVSLLSALVMAPEYADHAYDLVARNVEWLDIGLFANESFLTRMYACLTCITPCPNRAAAAYALRAIVLKRMPPEAKLNLLVHLQVLRLLSTMPASIPNEEDDVVAWQNIEMLPTTELSIQSARYEAAALVNTIASSAIDVLKASLHSKQTLEGISPQASKLIQVSSSIAEAALPLALRYGSAADVEDVEPQDSLQCVTAYMSTFSRLNNLYHKQSNGVDNDLSKGLGHVSVQDWVQGRDGIVATLNVIEEKACFPVDYDPRAEDHPFVALRHVLLKSVLRAIARSLPAMVLAFVRRLVSDPCSSSARVPRSELALAVLAILSEIAPDVDGLHEILIGVFSNPPAFPERNGFSSEVQSHQFEEMIVAHFELLARCYRIILTSQDSTLLVSVLSPFLDSRGIRHPSSSFVRSKAAYLLLKVIRPLRTIVSVRHLGDVVGTIQPLLFPLQAYDSSQGFSYQMNMFETVGYLIGTDTNRSESIAHLASLLNSIVASLRTASNEKEKIRAVAAAGQLSKGFGGDSKPLLLLSTPSTGIYESANGIPTFEAAVENFQPNLIAADRSQGHCRYPSIEEADVKVQKPRPMSAEAQSLWAALLVEVLVSVGFMSINQAFLSCISEKPSPELIEKVAFILHRMIDTMGENVVPYLRPVLVILLKFASNASQVRDVVALTSQAVGKFATAFENDLIDLFAEIATSVGKYHVTLDPSTLFAISEEDREAAELRKAYFYLIHSILTNNVPKVLLARPMLGRVVSDVLDAMIGHTLDVRGAATTMKMCTSSIQRMVVFWGSMSTSELSSGSVSDSQPEGFREYVVNEVAPACVRAALCANIFREADYSTGYAGSVLTENVSLQRTCAMRLGPSFGQSMQTRGFRGMETPEILEYLNSLYEFSTPVHALVPLFTKVLQQIRGLGNSNRVQA